VVDRLQLLLVPLVDRLLLLLVPRPHVLALL